MMMSIVMMKNDDDQHDEEGTNNEGDKGMQVSRRTWREAARFPESGVLPLSLTTLHEEVKGRICFVYGCSHRSDGEKCSFFRFPYPCYTTWALGKTVQVKLLMIDTINLDMNDPEKRKTRPDSTEFSLLFCNLGFSAT